MPNNYQQRRSASKIKPALIASAGVLVVCAAVFVRFHDSDPKTDMGEGTANTDPMHHPP